jgi:hypothetical protein
MVLRLVESGVGEAAAVAGGAPQRVLYAEVAYDAPDVAAAGLPERHAVAALPALLCFERGLVVAREQGTARLGDEDWVAEWIRDQARRAGRGPGGGAGVLGLFGGLFGGSRG